MSNIFDQARDILKNIQSTASNAGNSFYNALPSQKFEYDYRSPAPKGRGDVIGNPQQMKLTVNQNINNTVPTRPPAATVQPVAPTIMPQATQQPQIQTGWQSKFQPIYDKTLPQKKLTKHDVQVLVTSENGKEDPGYQNFNIDKKTGKKVSVDTGLLQINTPLDSPEISKLKDPEYNINKGLGILRQRNDILGDPVLAIASYNLGAGGAVLNPEKALNRARVIYKNAGVPLPETPFTKDPKGFVNQRMDSYKSYGLFK